MAIQIATFCRVAIGVVFALAFVSKIFRRRQFEQALATFGVPLQLQMVGSSIVLVTELSITLCMCAGGRWLQIGFILAVASLSIFSVALVRILRSRQSVICHCLGVGDKPVGVEGVWRNGAVMVCAASALMVDSESATNAMLINNWQALTPAITAAIVFVLFCTHLNELGRLYFDLRLLVASAR
jgi:hypothetical protein